MTAPSLVVAEARVCCTALRVVRSPLRGIDGKVKKV